MKHFLMSSIIAGLALGSPQARSLEPTDQQALQNTQNLLRDESTLKTLAATNPDAAKALEQVRHMTKGNSDQMAEVNNIAAAIFEDMVQSTNGDSAAIQEKLQQALKDPNAFMAHLSPERQARIRQLASEIDARDRKK